MRTAMRTVIFACLMALALADTTGTALPGYDYTFGSDVQGYLDISQDVCDIAAAADASDWATADTLYRVGRNSIRSTGELRTLQGWAIDGSDEEAHWGLFSRYYGNDSAWLDTFITAGLEGEDPWTSDAARAQIVKKGIQSNLLTAYMFHEVDEAVEEIEAGETDPAGGAPHVIDEAAAIYFSNKCAAGGIADVATKRATTFGTLVAAADGTCVAPTNVAAAAALKAMQAAALAGDVAAYSTAAMGLEKVIVTIFTQATLTYASELQEIVEAGSETAGALPDTAEAAAEGTAFFRTIAPLVAQVSEEDAATISALLAAPTATMAGEISDAFQATLDAYAITPAELGTLNAASACTSA
ncbi:hypothetical protein D9Q98_007183 [Chlorella vulgaris]|uniref:Uncharacterized protein n=1 Tax=Chlorella vulgaris TaxID=3077 RepID=A0A9D4YUN3_CHLVU|nr:hypothetical protein D9Q98_007183 [Chlorella vulgaris]